ncbi:TetR/AcrR family transcriptional regulator [Bacillus sp. V33-4]|uniref:TetR/AcrR family transcriptional regulator n=1 Tax=Bacillus sp. V33-4 TaxID=2054169 RepID=UPI000C765BB4|nr:TetR/AcrR family transcriptional regulator [Bacillus sp. V33-4]PLR85692.1 TetR family transcriptional regulator [Bacillus sp. V33-4]
MPYPKNHKQKSREAIIQSASRAFRKSGIDSVSVPKIMNAAGLTHGGFYAHFESKDQLVAEACLEGMKETIDFFRKITTSLTPSESLIKIIQIYLSMEHLHKPEQGCVLPTLGSEVRQQSDLVRNSYTESLHELIDLLRKFLPESYKNEAIFIVSSMVGAMMLARAINDPDMSETIIVTCQEQLKVHIRSLF